MSLKGYIGNKLGVFDKEKAWIFVIIKPGFEKYAQDIIKEFTTERPTSQDEPGHGAWELTKTVTKVLTETEAKELYKIHRKEEWYKPLWEYMSSGPTTAMIFTRPSEKMSTKVFKETGSIKDEIRKKWGESDMRNVIHSSDSLKHMLQESSIYFVI